MKKKVLLSIVAISWLISGCSTTSTDPKIEMKPPKYVEEIPPKTTSSGMSNPGSLFGQGENPLFSDRKAMNVNDILTVVISETTAQSSTASKSLSKDNSANLGGGVVTAGGLPSVANSINKATNIGLSTTSNSAYTGSGSNTRNESFTTTISARIIKVLQNGNYFIEGSRELLINGEKQLIQISGVIRPYDISQTNQIDSKYIADAKIMYKTQGEIEQSTKKPWGTKIIDSVWPF